jgi:hypothetical protein
MQEPPLSTLSTNEGGMPQGMPPSLRSRLQSRGRYPPDHEHSTVVELRSTVSVPSGEMVNP